MRRIVSGLLAALFLLSVGVVAATPSAQADFWCWDDPVVSIGGQTFSILVGVHGDPATVRRGIREADVTIMVPEGSQPAVLRSTNVYFNEDVHFVEVPGFAQGPSKTVQVLVRFDSSATFPAALAIDGKVVDQGSTRGVLHASFSLR